MHWIYLVVAIVAEVMGTAFLKSSNGFQNVLPSIGVIVGYGLYYHWIHYPKICRNA